MSRCFDPDTPPKSGVSKKLWNKFTAARFWYDGAEKPAGVSPDVLVAIQPGCHQRNTGAASYFIEWELPGVQRAEILIWDAERALKFPLDGARLKRERHLPGRQYWIDCEGEEE